MRAEKTQLVRIIRIRNTVIATALLLRSCTIIIAPGERGYGGPDAMMLNVRLPTTTDQKPVAAVSVARIRVRGTAGRV